MPGASVTLRYQLATLRHRKPLINGSSGFVSPLVTLFQGAASPLTTLDTVDDALGIVRAIGGRYVVVHLHEYRTGTRGHIAQVLDHMRADTHQVESVLDFGSTKVLTLTAAPAARAPVPCRRARARPLPALGVSRPRPRAASGGRRPGLTVERPATGRYLGRSAAAPGPPGGRREARAAAATPSASTRITSA